MILTWASTMNALPILDLERNLWKCWLVQLTVLYSVL